MEAAGLDSRRDIIEMSLVDQERFQDLGNRHLFLELVMRVLRAVTDHGSD